MPFLCGEAVSQTIVHPFGCFSHLHLSIYNAPPLLISWSSKELQAAEKVLSPGLSGAGVQLTMHKTKRTRNLCVDRESHLQVACLCVRSRYPFCVCDVCACASVCLHTHVFTCVLVHACVLAYVDIYVCVCVCESVYMCVCESVCMCGCACTHVHACVCAHLCMCVCACMRVCVCLCACAMLSVCMGVCTCVMCVCVCVCVCVFMHVCVLWDGMRALQQTGCFHLPLLCIQKRC